MSKIYLLFLMLLQSACFISKGENIVLGNELFRYELSTKGNRIKATSYYDLTSGRELLEQTTNVPYFEFAVNGRLLSANDPVWKYKGTQKRQLSNGGEELTSTFDGIGFAQGIRLVLDHQHFPGSALVRERMRLQSKKNTRITLNNIDEKNHFVYPAYSFRSDGYSPVTEIRMASYNKEILHDFEAGRTYENRPFRNLAGCHMFHIDSIKHQNNGASDVLLKGPFAIIPTGPYKIITTYEHASQDQLFVHDENSGDNSMIDPNQGVKGALDFVPSDDSFWFIATRINQTENTKSISQNILRGGYLDGEAIPNKHYYETVWSTLNFIPIESDHYAAIKHYILNQITENPLSRKAEFYYNTWGMQRDAESEGTELWEMFNEKRILEEIDYASELNVDIIVLDDGWEEKLGEWKPNKRKLPSGFTPIIEKIRGYNMIPGIWLSLMGIDSTAARYKEHPEWVVRDANGEPIEAQWSQPAFDIVGGFYDAIKQDHIALIDQGFRFFKWDAINTFNSFAPDLDHGDASYSRKERIDRYNYLVPFYVVRLMRELREYNPEVLVEIDLTEPERTIVGLMPLQEGKLFWMNNGASGYGDYSTMRTKSMRNIINQTGRLLPPEIFTYATYPHNTVPYFAQRYNINTTLIAGRGLWGNLKRMTSEERKQAGSLIAKSKLVLPHISGKPLTYEGLIGATPELYMQLNEEQSYGQIIGFSGSVTSKQVRIPLHTDNLLGVLNHAYTTVQDSVKLDFQFPMPDDTREAFILGNDGSGLSILSSTGWLDQITQEENSVRILTGSAGTLTIKLPHSESIRCNVPYKQDKNTVTIHALEKQEIHIEWEL